MATINTLSSAPPPAPAKREGAAKGTAHNEPSAASPPQTDSYDKTTVKDYVPPPKGAVRYGELSAKSALADGTFFESDFAAYAASYSLQSTYTFSESFRAAYGGDKTKAVEYGFDSLRTMMESIVLRQGDDGNVTTSFA